MTWIKICGTTNLEDALLAVDAGADALGFVFHPKSPRRIEPEAARGIVEKMTASVEKVGIFVNEPVEAVAGTVRGVGLSAVQLHGDEDLEYARRLLQQLGPPSRIYGVLPMNRISMPPSQGADWAWDVAAYGALTTDAAEMFTNLTRDAYEHAGEPVPPVATCSPGVLSGLILDSGSAAGEGGTGKAFDWERARPFVEGTGSFMNIIVAGGLNPENVGRMIRTLHPWGVDVVSGVEEFPGKKDPRKVRAFVEAVREAETSY